MTLKLYTSLFCLFIVFSCSKGDNIIEDTIIDFEGILENCSNQNNNTFVFYKTTSNPNRSLSINFSSSTFSMNPSTSNISVTEPTVITLNSSNNLLIYREFNESIDDVNYFCNSIPPSGIIVTNQLTSGNGTLEISYEQNDVNNTSQYKRTITLKNITLEGNGTIIRRELLVLGTDIITVPN